jgi:hypothetical protein
LRNDKASTNGREIPSEELHLEIWDGVRRGSRMTFNEMRLTKYLANSAREILKDDPALLDSYGGFERVMWPSDNDLHRWNVTRKQFRRCCVAAYEELKRER